MNRFFIIIAATFVGGRLSLFMVFIFKQTLVLYEKKVKIDTTIAISHYRHNNILFTFQAFVNQEEGVLNSRCTKDVFGTLHTGEIKPLPPTNKIFHLPIETGLIGKINICKNDSNQNTIAIKWNPDHVHLSVDNNNTTITFIYSITTKQPL